MEYGIREYGTVYRKSNMGCMGYRIQSKLQYIKIQFGIWDM